MTEVEILTKQNQGRWNLVKGRSIMTQDKAFAILDKIEKMLLELNLDTNELLTLYARITNIVISEVDE